MNSELDLLQGTLDVLVLRALSWGRMHGYAVARFIRDGSDGSFAVYDGALYTALHRLEEKGWLASEWGVSENNRKARYYQLTKAGHRQLGAETDEWRRLAAAMTAALQAT